MTVDNRCSAVISHQEPEGDWDESGPYSYECKHCSISCNGFRTPTEATRAFVIQHVSSRTNGSPLLTYNRWQAEGRVANDAECPGGRRITETTYLSGLPQRK